MTIQRRFAPISGRFEPERVAGFAGISSDKLAVLFCEIFRRDYSIHGSKQGSHDSRYP